MLSGIYFGFGILPDILSGIYSACILTFSQAFYHPFILIFYLASFHAHMF